jgi:hypothetical protein
MNQYPLVTITCPECEKKLDCPDLPFIDPLKGGRFSLHNLNSHERIALCDGKGCRIIQEIYRKDGVTAHRVYAIRKLASTSKQLSKQQQHKLRLGYDPNKEKE